MIKDMAQKLHDLRIKHGYSQKEVADKLGVSPSIISGYETNQRTPSSEVILALAYLYHCSTDYLLGKENQTPDAVIDVSDLTPNQIKVIHDLIEIIKTK